MLVSNDYYILQSVEPDKNNTYVVKYLKSSIEPWSRGKLDILVLGHNNKFETFANDVVYTANRNMIKFRIRRLVRWVN